MKNIAIVISGCGHQDGAEITETISSLIALGQNHAQFQMFAPNINFTPINHLTSEKHTTHQQRNCLEEAARLARGSIADLKTLQEKNFDALLFPGGYGAATHLSNWAEKGAKGQVLPEIEQIIMDFHKASKPIGAICIAPTLLAIVLGSKKVSLTIGDNKEHALEIEKTGAQHIECPVDDYITDRLHKIISTPAYMYKTQPCMVFKGISGLIKELVEMA